MLHDLARGMDGRPLRPRKPVEQLRAEAELEPPVDTLEPLRFVLRNLCGALCEQLTARGAGATRALLVLDMERGQPLLLDQELPEPAAAPDLLERLLFARLTASPPTSARDAARARAARRASRSPDSSSASSRRSSRVPRGSTGS